MDLTSVSVVDREEGHRRIFVEVRHRLVGVLHAIPPRRVLRFKHVFGRQRRGEGITGVAKTEEKKECQRGMEDAIPRLVHQTNLFSSSRQ